MWREERRGKKKWRWGKSEAILQNTTCATLHEKWHCVASKVMVKASVLPPDGGSRRLKSVKLFHILVAFLYKYF